MLVATPGELTPEMLSALWRVFSAVDTTWGLGGIAPALRSQWQELLVSRIEAQPSYFGEFENAVLVVDELVSEFPDRWSEFLFFETVVVDETRVSTRLQHAKYFVFNDFLRAFVMLGGFASFGGKNYTGYMGGSRFRDVPPVRTGAL